MTTHDRFGTESLDLGTRAIVAGVGSVDDAGAEFRPTFWEIVVPLALGGLVVRLCGITAFVLWRHGVLANLVFTGSIVWLAVAAVTGGTLVLLGSGFALIRMFPHGPSRLARRRDTGVSSL